MIDAMDITKGENALGRLRSTKKLGEEGGWEFPFGKPGTAASADSSESSLEGFRDKGSTSINDP